jgi:hypothetical protein
MCSVIFLASYVRGRCDQKQNFTFCIWTGNVHMFSQPKRKYDIAALTYQMLVCYYVPLSMCTLPYDESNIDAAALSDYF